MNKLLDFLIKLPVKILAKRNHKNELLVSSDKFHQTAMGFQAINGESYVSFPKNSRSHNMMLFVAELRKRNLSNKEIASLLIVQSRITL